MGKCMSKKANTDLLDSDMNKHPIMRNSPNLHDPNNNSKTKNLNT